MLHTFNEKNRDLPDLSGRELALLIPISALILVLGLASPLVLRRVEPTTKNILLHVESPQFRLAQVPPAAEAQR